MVVTLTFTNTTSSQNLTLTGLLVNAEANTTLTNGNPRVLVPVPDTSLYYTLPKQAGKNTQFATFLDIAQNGRLDVILQKVDDQGIP